MRGTRIRDWRREHRAEAGLAENINVGESIVSSGDRRDPSVETSKPSTGEQVLYAAAAAVCPRSKSGCACLEVKDLKKPGLTSDARPPRLVGGAAAGAGTATAVGDAEVSGSVPAARASSIRSSSIISFDGGVVVMRRHEVYAADENILQ